MPELPESIGPYRILAKIGRTEVAIVKLRQREEILWRLGRL